MIWKLCLSVCVSATAHSRLLTSNSNCWKLFNCTRKQGLAFFCAISSAFCSSRWHMHYVMLWKDHVVHRKMGCLVCQRKFSVHYRIQCNVFPAHQFQEVSASFLHHCMRSLQALYSNFLVALVTVMCCFGDCLGNAVICVHRCFLRSMIVCSNGIEDLGEIWSTGYYPQCTQRAVFVCDQAQSVWHSQWVLKGIGPPDLGFETYLPQ